MYRVAFVTLLVLVFGASQIKGSGHCPPSSEIPSVCVIECRSDTQCKEYKVCCQTGCGAGGICLDPIHEQQVKLQTRPEKHGDCPKPKWPGSRFGACVVTCLEDTDCAVGKCCNNGCGKTCEETCRFESAAVKTNLGACVEECSSDEECAFGRCCSNGCGHTCQETCAFESAAVKTNLGACVEECSSDEECAFGRCCSNGCGHTCQETCAFDSAAVKTNLGACVEECSSDEECAFGSCCSNGCGHTCQETCAFESAARKTNLGACVEECSSDEECAFGRCCSNGCGHTCQEYCAFDDFKKSIPNLKANRRPETQQLGACLELCSDDFSCPADHKCCSNGCGHTCVKACSTEKPKQAAPEGCWWKEEIDNEGCTNYSLKC